MGWYTDYRVNIHRAMVNFDANFVDSWCSEMDFYTEVHYMRYQYKNPLIVYVTIKYGKYEIEHVLEMLMEKFRCRGRVTIVNTDETEWKDWSKTYDMDVDFGCDSD